MDDLLHLVIYDRNIIGLIDLLLVDSIINGRDIICLLLVQPVADRRYRGRICKRWGLLDAALPLHEGVLLP